MVRERLTRALSHKTLARRPLLVLVGAIVGFLAILTTQLQSSVPEIRLPAQYRLAALIQRQQKENEQQRAQVNVLRNNIDQARNLSSNQHADADSQNSLLSQSSVGAGTTAVRGAGFVVTLDDSSLTSSPSGNVNDLVIHSQDVQAVVNGMWAAGAEAIAINGQRLVSTSAILCVGNTLLLNGSVHAPPYEISGIGINHARFLADPLVRQLRADANQFSLRFSVGRDTTVDLPAYQGSTELHYAQPVGP